MRSYFFFVGMGMKKPNVVWKIVTIICESVVIHELRGFTWHLACPVLDVSSLGLIGSRFLQSSKF